MNQNITNETEKKILAFLEENKNNYMNLSEISKELNISYPTITKRIEILERLGVIKVIIIGNNKVCILEEEQ